MNSVQKVSIEQKLELFKEYWSPKVVGELNDQQVKLVKIKGEFVWHKHDNEDELFMVIKGKMDMHFRDKIVEVNEGEFIIVPRGVEHKPVAEKETHIMLLEPKGVVNTGNAETDRTAANDVWI